VFLLSAGRSNSACCYCDTRPKRHTTRHNKIRVSVSVQECSVHAMLSYLVLTYLPTRLLAMLRYYLVFTYLPIYLPIHLHAMLRYYLLFTYLPIYLSRLPTCYS
jgi:hypothetical protein